MYPISAYLWKYRFYKYVECIIQNGIDKMLWDVQIFYKDHYQKSLYDKVLLPAA